MWCRKLSKVIFVGLALGIGLSSAQPGGMGNQNNNNQGNQGNSGSSSSTKSKIVRFLAPWTNTNAVLYVNGDSTGIMTSVSKYCGWYEKKVTTPTDGFEVYFKQTIGHKYYSVEGIVADEPSSENWISLDSIAALGDTLWVRAFKADMPELYSQYPGVLGDCPEKELPVMMFDWYDGSRDNAKKYNPATRDESLCNLGTDANYCTTTYGGTGISSNFGGDNVNLCWPSSPVSSLAYYEEDRNLTDYQSSVDQVIENMVLRELGANGVPVRNESFSWATKCKNADYLNKWFVPETLVVKDGKAYTNATCRNMTMKLDDDGIWRAQMDSKADSSVGEARGGMFLIDDFQWLDSAKTIPNPYYDSIPSGFTGIDGSGKSSSNAYHNYGMSMKVQATFEYVRGQYFEFLGDDDVWVYIDGKLVVDIGGVHDRRHRAVDLDTLKLIEGETYTFNIFYTERYKVQGNFKMRTSMDLKADASMFISSYMNNNLKQFEVWQINKKDALSCDFSASAKTTTDTTGGASSFRLTGNNMDSVLTPGVIYFEGLNIESDSTFTLDSATIVDNATLPPGHYFLEITLKSDPSQSTKVEITVPSYAVPTVAFATDDWKLIGKEVSGDTLQIGDWAYATYKVNVMFYEDWAVVTNYNKKVSIAFSDPNISVEDSTGRIISTVNLDENGHASFYVHANAAVTGATLVAKGSASTPSSWINLNFKEPPIPHVTNAIIVDRNGDGRADSMYVSYDKNLKDQCNLDSIQFTFGEAFATTTKYKIVNGTDLVITAESIGKTCSTDNCGFGSRQFTGADTLYTGKLNSWFTYTEGNKATQFNTENEKITDGVGPIVMKAVKTKLDDGNRELDITMSEALTDESLTDYANLLEFICMRSGIKKTPENPVQAFASGSSLTLIYSPSTDDAILPDNGDQLRFLTSNLVTRDLSGNKPHANNPWVTITGDQEMSNEAPGVIAVGEDPYGIIANTKETTQPTLINNTSQDAQDIGDSLGVQGHLIDFDISKIMEEQTQNEIDALDAFIEGKLGSTTSYDTTITAMTEAEALADIFKDINAGLIGENYFISEETVAAVQAGAVTADNYKSTLPQNEVDAIGLLITESVEASRDTVITKGTVSTTTQADLFEMIRSGTMDKELEKAGVSASTIEAIKNGTLNENNVDQYRNGTETLVSDTAVVLHYQTRYYSQFGEYVGGASKTIKCSDETVYGRGGCLENKGRLFLAWNMRSDSGRLVGTGVYIARLQMQVKVNGKTTLDQTRDKLMGVRRGQVTGLNLEF